jgi:hypothetical protein
MLLPARPNPLPGLALASLPPVVLGGFGFAFLSLLGEEELARVADAAGPYSVLMVGAGLALMGVLSGLLCLGLTTRRAPLLVLVGLATLPWFLGIAGTDEAVARVLAALPDVGGGDALAVLVAGMGGAMVTRLLGAWMSAALLVGVGVGLGFLGRRGEEGEEEVVGSPLGATLALVLGVIALLVALEAHHLFELLTALAARAPEARAQLLRAGTSRLEELREMRFTALVALGVLSLTLVSWQFLVRPKAVAQWVGSITLALLAATVLLMDARPLERAAAGAREAGLTHTLLPLPALVRHMRLETSDPLSLPEGPWPLLPGGRDGR